MYSNFFTMKMVLDAKISGLPGSIGMRMICMNQGFGMETSQSKNMLYL